MNYLDIAPLNQNSQGLYRSVSAVYDDTLTGDSVYKANQLVTVTGTGETTRLIEATPANIARVALALHDHAMGVYVQEDPNTGEKKFLSNLYNKLIDPQEPFIGTWQGGEGDTVDGDFSAADLVLVRTGASVELDWNATQKMMTVRDGTTNPTVQLIDVFKGGVGIPNTLVLFKFLPSVLLGQN